MTDSTRDDSKDIPASEDSPDVPPVDAKTLDTEDPQEIMEPEDSPVDAEALDTKDSSDDIETPDTDESPVDAEALDTEDHQETMEPSHTPYNEIRKPDTKSPRKTTMTRSAYRGLLITALVGIIASTFFAGYFVAMYTNSDYITRAQLEEMLVRVDAEPKILISLDDDPMIGDPDAPVTIVEFSDFQCPFCSRFYHQTLPLIMENYVKQGTVNIVFRDFPIDQIHPNARITHIASECADEQNQFWPYHDILFEKQSQWKGLAAAEMAAAVVTYAQELSLDVPSFAACLSSPEINAEVNADKTAGVQYGVSGTPAFFIGNPQTGYILVSGAQPFDAFASAINQKLS